MTSQSVSSSSDHDVPEAIAVVGMSCRFSGTATSPDNLWQMLTKGLTGWSSNAGDRFRLDAFWHPQGDLSGSFNTRGLHLLKQNPALFDNGFFGISNVEAKAIDPQQRMMLEVAYEAFEDAGLPLHKLEGSDTAVFCAVSNNDYDRILGRDGEVSPGYRFTGTGNSMIANRLSYFFDLRGPSITLDTACSSGLVALHEACKSIYSGEVSQALVGGSNLILDPDQTTVMSSMSFLSPHGRCYSFDERADGFGRGEGVAAVMLKSMKEALRDGDCIRAVIRGTGVVQDGRTPGITMPSCEAQKRMIQTVYARAKLDPGETPYVEAHGTGTTVGDSIEASALKETFCNSRDSQSLLVGSVKSNIGHTESVAGLAGVIKTVLALEKGIIPPNPTFAEPSSRIPLREWKIEVPTSLTKWPENTKRRASVNSFGYGGTNGHVILESVEEFMGSIASTREAPLDSDKRVPRLFVLSHALETGLGEASANLKRLVLNAKESETAMSSLAKTLGRRSRLDFKSFVVASTRQELIEGLERQVKGEDRVSAYVTPPTICFAFSGQGAQWAGMGQELLQTNPVFAESMHRSEKILLQLGSEWRLIEEVCKNEGSRINTAMLSQPACTAIQIALVDMLKMWNILPHAVVGHSSGEIAAAYAAGMVSAEAALKVAFHRGQAVMTLKQKHPHLRGAMLAAGMSAAKAREFILDKQDLGKAVVACENSPGSVTISGDESAVSAVQDCLSTAQIFNRRLIVDTAYHSHHMQLIEEDYHTSIHDMSCGMKRQDVSMVSSVDGNEVKDHTLDARYWCQNLISPVRFVDAMGTTLRTMRRAQAKDPIVVVEIGPHAALAGPIKQIIKAEGFSGIECLSVLTRNQDASNTSMTLAGQLFQRGHQGLNFDAINNPYGDAEGSILSDLPTYNWTHKSPLWSESRRSINHRFRKFPRHDLLGTLSIDSVSEEPTWRNYLSVREQPWLVGHAIADSVIFPAAGYLSMAMEALRQVTLIDGKPWKNVRIKFKQVKFGSALIIPEDAPVETLLMFRPHATNDSWKEFRIFSNSSTGNSTEHCRGLASVEPQSSANRDLSDDRTQMFVKDISDKSQTYIDPVKLYRELRAVGLQYSSHFTNQKHIRASSEATICRIEIPDVKASMPGKHQQSHCIHPSTLDLCIQSLFPIMKMADLLGSSVVVSSISSLEVHSEIPARPGQGLDVATKLRQYGRSKVTADTIVISSRAGSSSVFMKMKGLVASAGGSLHAGASQRPSGQSLTHRLQWSIDPTFASSETILGLCRLSRDELKSRGANSLCEEYTRKLIHKTLASLSTDDRANIQGHHGKLLQWMQSNSSVPSKESYAGPIENLEAEVKATGPHGETLIHISPHLPDVLRGRVDGLDLLRQKDRLYSMYNYDNYDRNHRQLARYVQLLQFKNPNMRILEIGAGTASTTLPILEALGEMADCSGRPKIEIYTFTDISTGFFENAESKLDKFRNVLEFRKLDIETSPSLQGIEPGSYDLVIATNVLHATSDIKNTLSHVRSLLKPTGHLALMEFTVPTLYTGLIFGMLPGWWLSSDGRENGPLLSTCSWNENLTASGFSGVDIEMQDYENDEHEMSLLISTARQHADFSDDLSQRIATRLSFNSDSVPSISASRSSVSSVGDQEAVTPVSSISTDDASHAQTIQILHGPAEKRVAQQLSKTFQDAGVMARPVDLSSLTPEDQLVVVLLELRQPFLMTCSEDEWNKIRTMCQVANGVLWTTTGAAIECTDPMRSLITGLGRCLQSENHAIGFTTLDLEAKLDDETELNWETTVCKHICSISQHNLNSRKLSSCTEWEFAVRDGNVLVPRLVEDVRIDNHIRDSVSKFHPRYEQSLRNDRALGLSIRTPGLLDTLYWSDSKKHSRGLGKDEVRVEMKFISLNFKDIMIAMGQLDDHTALLLEGTGRVTEIGDGMAGQLAVGDLVYVCDFDGLANNSIIHKSCVHALPKRVDLQSAAAAGIAFATALYSLEYAGKLQEGESVLIHSGAGAVGQAAITLAQHYFQAGDVFVTVGSEEKRNFIKEKFGIADENIFSSRGLDFYDAIVRRTNGEGVDVVLNSLSGEALQRSVELLAPLGRFVEIGKKDLISPEARLEMRSLEKNVQFSSVDLTLVGRRRPSQFHQVLQSVFGLLAKEQISTISPVTVMPVSELEEACRLMQAGKHIGKLLVELNTGGPLLVQPSRPADPELNPDGTYLIVGGTGGLGKAVLRLLADLGAKRVVTLSRSGADSQAMQQMIAEMSMKGVEVVAHQGSVMDKEAIEQVKSSCSQYPIRGVIQGAMVLRDSRVENMTYQDWRTAIEPKVHGTWNLHEAFGSSLDFFVLLSSSGGIVGSFSQGNYCAGNTFQDAFARYRAGLQLSGRTINVGFVEGEGYTAENESAAEFVRRQGLTSYKLEEFLVTIKEAIANPIARTAREAQLLCGISRAEPGSGSPEAALQRPDSKFSHIWKKANSSEQQSTSQTGQIDVQAVLSASTSTEEALDATSQAIKSKLAKLLAIPVDEIRSDRSITSYGLDSLIAVELRNWLSTVLEAQVQMFELMSSMPFVDLAAVVAKRSRLVPRGVFEEKGSAV